MPAYANFNSSGSPLVNGTSTHNQELPESCRYAKYQGDIVVSGMSGRIGQCDTLADYKDILWNKKDAFTEKSMRYDIELYKTQKSHAYINDAEKFDSDYFGIAPKNAEFLDPCIRLGMEAAYEAVVDGGYSMQEMRGTMTGVYVPCVAYEANCYWLSKGLDVIGTASRGLGVINNFRASRISFSMDLRGPSMCVDTACSGYLAAVETAVKDIRLGLCEQAIVASCQMHCNPMGSLLFMELGAAGPDARCYSFDHRAQGFGRCEAVGAMLIQKEGDARRVYCKIPHVYQSCDGASTEHDFNHPSEIGQKHTIEECYRQADIDISKVEFVECHGTGTKAGDSVEASAIDSAFCSKPRAKPLMIGSCKTNVGHAEASAGFNAMVKCIFSINECVIPPNINFEKPNPAIAGLLEGRLKVPTELTPWSGEICGISGFGIGGTNSHMILKKNDKPNTSIHPSSGAMRLFCYHARTEDGLRNVLNAVQKNSMNVGFQALLQASSNEPVHKMPFRGYTILNHPKNITEIKNAKSRKIVYACTGMGCQWNGQGMELMQIEVFRNSVQKSCEIVKKKFNCDLYDAMKTGTSHTIGNGLGAWISIPIVQVALIDTLSAMGVQPDFIMGHSLGEVAAAYADGNLTREEAMLVPYARFSAAKATPQTQGLMAAVGMKVEELEAILPKELDLACHNAEESCTVSGQTPHVRAFVQKLESMGIFAKEVDSLGVAFHSRLIGFAAPEMKRQLTVGGLVGKPRSSKWLSTCYAKSDWNKQEAKIADADYFTYNYTHRVRFYETAKLLPKNPIVIEIAPSGLLQSLLKKCVGPKGEVVALQKKNYNDNLTYFFETLGTMYMNGVNMKPLNVFPEVKFPVPQNTPMCSPLIAKQWCHDETFRVPHIDDISDPVEASHADVKDSAQSAKPAKAPTSTDPEEPTSKSSGGGDAYEVTYDFSEGGNGHFILGHVVNGTKLFPAAGYILTAWEAFAAKHGKTFQELPVVLESVSIVRATPLPVDGKLTFQCRIMHTGEFEVTENKQLVTIGKICMATDAHKALNEMRELDEKIKSLRNTRKPSIPQTRDEIYLGMANQGLDYSGVFRGILGTDLQSMDFEWTGEWIAFLDFHFQAAVWFQKGDSHVAPLKMDAIHLDASEISRQLLAGDKPVCKLIYDQLEMGYMTSPIMKMKHCEMVNTAYKPSGNADLEEVRFIPYTANTKVNDTLRQYATDCLRYTVNGLEEALNGGKFPLLTNNRGVVSDALKEFRFKAAKSSDEDLSKACQLPNSGLAKTLKKIFPPIGTTTDPATVGEIIAASKVELAKDRLIDSLSHSDVLHAALEIVKFNFPHGSKHTVLELDASTSKMYRHIIPYLTEITGINYVATDKGKMPKDFRGPGTQAVKWDMDSSASMPNIKAGLMVLKHVLHKQKDVVAALNNVLPHVVPGGFILVEEVTHNFPLFVALEGLHQDVMLPTTNGTREYGRFMTDSTWQSYFAKRDLDLVYRKSDGLLSTMYLLRKRQKNLIEPIFMRVDGLEHDWFDDVQTEMSRLEMEPKDSGKRLWLVCDTPNSGVYGMVQCMRKEPGGDKVRFVQNSNLNDRMEKADLSVDRLKKTIVNLDLYHNVFRDGQYGFYARKPLDYSFRDTSTSSDAYVVVPIVGDMSSAKWASSNQELLAMDDYMGMDKEKYVSVYYSAINDRDILYASGQIPKTDDLIWRYNSGLYGYEFVGRRQNGSRVVGLVPGLALATGLSHTRGLVIDLPDTWTMKDAATVPYCYLYVYYALVAKNPLAEGQTILVHSGATAMGTAAIRTALNAGAIVYTTVHSEEEKKYLRKYFPQLPESHVIFRKTELSITDGIEKLTNGQGVNVVLSPYADESLFDESVPSISTSGHYIEMGRPTASKPVEEFAAKLMQKNMVYTRVDASLILNDKASHTKLAQCISEDMKKGLIKPISATVYQAKDISQAFEAASKPRAMGKVLVQIREEETYEGSVAQQVNLPVFPRVTCDPRKTYIMCGGLGGLGLELTHWLVQRGARNIILTSRRGVTTGYQEYKIKTLQENYKANVRVIATQLRSTSDGKWLIQQAQQMGPVGGIFILSLVLRDRYMAMLTRETFAEAANSKIKDTIFMDEASRELCGSELDWFVPFSSLASGYGNAAQTNYGFGNSVMERTCEKRKADGLTGIVVQWGAIGDVGAFMGKTGLEKEAKVMMRNFAAMGLGIQRIDSCLHAMDTFLLLKKENVVSSHEPCVWNHDEEEEEVIEYTPPPPKKAVTVAPPKKEVAVAPPKREVSVTPAPQPRSAKSAAGPKKSLLVATAKVFGRKSMDNVSDDLTLGSLGLDSLMAVEMKQMLEKDFDIQLSLVDIRKMSMERLRELDEEAGSITQSAPQIEVVTETRQPRLVKNVEDEIPQPRPVKKSGGSRKSLLDATARVFGRKSMDNVSDDVTLGSLGLDSLMAVEMKQMLEKDFDIQLSLVDIRKMSMERLREMDEDAEDAPAPAPQRMVVVETPQPRQVKKAAVSKRSLLDATARVFGRKSMDNVSDDVTLGSLGLDSLMAVEMKQMLEKDFDIQLSLVDIRKMSMERLREMDEGEDGDNMPTPVPQREVVEAPAQPRPVKKASGPKKSLLAATCKVFGRKSMDNLSDDLTLGSLGLDSLMGVEMKQMLDRDFDLQISLVDIRKMTIERLRELDEESA